MPDLKILSLLLPPHSRKMARVTTIRIQILGTSLGALIGIIVVFLFFYFDYCIQLNLADYSPNVTLYSNRDYKNSENHEPLLGTTVVQIPRHAKVGLVLSLDGPATVYRFLSPSNDNLSFRGWKSADFSVKIDGHSCKMTQVVSSEFPAGDHRLITGGPIAASPVVVRADKPFSACNVARFNKFIHPLSFYKKRFALIGTLFALYLCGIWGLLGRCRAGRR